MGKRPWSLTGQATQAPEVPGECPWQKENVLEKEWDVWLQHQAWKTYFRQTNTMGPLGKRVEAGRRGAEVLGATVGDGAQTASNQPLGNVSNIL